MLIRTTLKKLIPFDKQFSKALAGERTSASIFHGQWKTSGDGKRIAAT
jgi:hypothetical protein